MKRVCEYLEITRTGQSVRDVVPAQPIPEREQVLAYLNAHGTGALAPMGRPQDAVNPSLSIDIPMWHDDGTFGWDTRAIYYFKKYNIPLDPAFIEHVLSQ